MFLVNHRLISGINFRLTLTEVGETGP